MSSCPNRGVLIMLKNKVHPQSEEDEEIAAFVNIKQTLAEKRKDRGIRHPLDVAIEIHDVGKGPSSGISAANNPQTTNKWDVLRKKLPEILEIGVRDGILPPKKPKPMIDFEDGFDENDEEAMKKSGEVVHLDINDVSLMHEAIPFLPLPVALICMFFNLFLPGIGTILSGAFCMCLGQPRIQFKSGRRVGTLLVNIGIGVSQMMTVTFMLVGWCWSIAWGGLMVIHSIQYREALMQRRQEAVATAAIEALTKDSVLHKRDVKKMVASK